MDYLNILKKSIIGILLILLICVVCKLTIFYIPFLIAYIISAIIDPVIKFIYKRTSFTRKTCSILVLVTIFSFFMVILIYGGIKLITETTNLLSGLNNYIEIAMDFISGITSKINYNELNLSNEVISIFENSTSEFLNSITEQIKNLLNKVLEYITSIPNLFINVIITILATYFISSDKLYILDRMEHHLSKKMVGKMMVHAKEITSSLGGYLKAEITLSFITFVIVLAGLNIFYLIGFDIQYPILMAIFIGFIDALPILGAGSVMIPWVIILFLEKSNSLALSILGLYFFILVTKQLLEPKLVSSNIGIHPIFTLIAMYTSFKIIGVIGLLVGPIILIIIKNVFAEILDKGIVNSLFEN